MSATKMQRRVRVSSALVLLGLARDDLLDRVFDLHHADLPGLTCCYSRQSHALAYERISCY